MIDRTEWFADCGWGVFCHWLGLHRVRAGGAELTWDVPIERNGLIPQTYVDQSRAIHMSIRKS